MRRVLFFIIILLSVSFVQAVGFANLPAEREFVFEPGKVIEVPLYVVGASNIGLSANIPEKGNPETLGTPDDDNIGEYVEIVDPASNTGPRQALLRISLPDVMKPGTYVIDVYASQYQGGEGTISAVAAAKLRFRVRVLSPEKRIEILAIGATPIAEGLNATATLRVVSRTTSPIEGLHAIFTLHDGEKTIVARSGTIPLASAEETVLKAELDTAALAGGEYDLGSSAYFDGNVEHSGMTVLKIGTLHVGIADRTEQILYNATNRFRFEIENQWNRELRDVYAHVELGEQRKKTASHSIAPFGKTWYEVYFDRDPSLSVGSHEVNITATYKDYVPGSGTYVEKVESIPVTVQVVMPAVEEKPGPAPMLLLAYGALGLLILLLIAVILLLVRRKPHEAQP